ncbi:MULTISPECIES: hypothetical protein [Streptomyces]|uniref:Uncharacterized protein n=1 Tax=Streptomyces griseosporeus TaxID=1910 RepID=A0ABV3KPR8_STRGS|nr:hypothetical protein [Streptomyces actuosus]
MAAREDSPEEPSRAAGACVLVALAAVVVALAFAVDEAAGILTLVVGGAVALWRSARRMPDSSATPPPPSEPPSGEVYARETTRVREVRQGPGEGLTIFPVVELVTDSAPDDE